VGLTRFWRRVHREARLDYVQPHDLRHSHASMGAAVGLSLPVLGKLLGHTQAVTTQRYSHVADDSLRQASERIGSRIAAAMDGGPPADIVSINRSQKSERGMTFVGAARLAAEEPVPVLVCRAPSLLRVALRGECLYGGLVWLASGLLDTTP